MRGEEICHPPQFPAPEVRLPIGAVGRMGTGSSTDLTVVGSHPVCRHFPREHMGNSSVAGGAVLLSGENPRLCRGFKKG